MKSAFMTILVCGLLSLSMPTLAGENDMIAKGSFELTLSPQTDDEITAGRMTIDKTFSGDLTGTSKGQMLSHRTAVEGSAGYVAIEHVSATLDGKTGLFTLQHSATMSGGEQSLNITVVPDSGTDGLTGISGSMNIIMEDGNHFYEFTYQITAE